MLCGLVLKQICLPQFYVKLHFIYWVCLGALIGNRLVHNIGSVISALRLEKCNEFCDLDIICWCFKIYDFLAAKILC